MVEQSSDGEKQKTPRSERQSRRGSGGGALTLATPADIEAVIVDADYQRMVRKAEEIARRLREPLLSAHLRPIYAELRLIEAECHGETANPLNIRQRLARLRPMIAYLAAKHRSSMGALRPVLELSIGRVQSDGVRLNRFLDLLTAILSYHRAI